MIYNTTTNKPNYFNGTKWISLGILSIGDYFLGGVVVYLDGSGGGLICAVSDQDGGSGIRWNNGRRNFVRTNDVDTLIGTGQANTKDIIADQDTGSYAATVCHNYSVDSYSNWFLPSRDELSEMYVNKATIDSTAIKNGGSPLGRIYYWSSSELDIFHAWAKRFGGGGRDACGKDAPYRVRAVRAF